MHRKIVRKKFRMAKNGCSKFFLAIFPKKTGINSEWPKSHSKFFLTIFPKKMYKLGMAKNGCSKFCLTIFPKKTGINLEWPKMAVPNFFQQLFSKKTCINSEWPKMAILNFFLDNFSQKDWYKFRMAKNGPFQIDSNLFGTNKLEEIWNGQKWAF